MYPRIPSLLFLPVLVGLIGCSGGEGPAPGAVSSKPAASTNDPIGAVAYDFMDAVFANDIARATQRLTPLAIQNMQAQDKRFEWGAETAELEIGQVRVEQDEAAVECRVSDPTNPGSTPEELLCVLRQVNGEWKVYGVAWEGGDDGQPQVVNFEDLPASTPPAGPRPSNGDRYVETPAPQIPAMTPPVGQSPGSVAEQPSGLLR